MAGKTLTINEERNIRRFNMQQPLATIALAIVANGC